MVTENYKEVQSFVKESEKSLVMVKVLHLSLLVKQSLLQTLKHYMILVLEILEKIRYRNCAINMMNYQRI